MRSAICLGVLLGLVPLSCSAQTDRYHVTPAEKAACTSDAVRLCIQTYPDENALLDCMKANREQLSPTCRVAFDAGVKRRRL